MFFFWSGYISSSLVYVRPSHFSRPPSRPSVPVSKSWKKGKDPASERRPCLPLVSSCPLPLLPLGKGKFCTGQGERATFKRPPGKGKKSCPLKMGSSVGAMKRMFSAAARPHPFSSPSSRSVKVDDGWGVGGGWKGANMQPTHTTVSPTEPKPPPPSHSEVRREIRQTLRSKSGTAAACGISFKILLNV